MMSETYTKMIKYSKFQITLKCCLFVRGVLTKSTIPPFQNYFNKSENLHRHNTRHTKQNSAILTQ